MTNIYDTANQLERDLREFPAFKELGEVLVQVRENEESNKLFEEFKQASQQFQMQQMTGQTPSEEEVAALQELSERVSQDELITKMMMCEQQLSQVIQDINRIITKPLQEIYQLSETE